MQRYAATGGIPDALLSCHRYDEILPPGAIQSCHQNECGLDCQIQRSAAAWRLRSEQQAVRCGLPVTRKQSNNFQTPTLVGGLQRESNGLNLACGVANGIVNRLGGSIQMCSSVPSGKKSGIPVFRFSSPHN